MKTMEKRQANPKIIEKLAKLEALAAAPGTPHEGKRAGKGTATGGGLGLHPYTFAVEYGRQIRFSVPAADLGKQIETKIAGALSAK